MTDIKKEAFIYTTETIRLTAGGAATATIHTNHEADFYCVELTSVSTGPFKFLIRDSSTDRQWSNNSLHSDFLNATDGRTLRFPEPRLVLRGATIYIDFTDMSLAANEVQLSYIGYKADHKFFF